MTLQNSNEYIVKVEFPKIFQVIETYLKPENRGFKLVHSGLSSNNSAIILYQSNQCKLRIRCNRDRPFDPLEFSVTYGRLHAPTDKDVMEWNGKQCHCWHGFTTKTLLPFLDKLSPAEAIELKQPRIEEEFINLWQGKDWESAEIFTRKHALIWEHYGQHFFDLFDLNRPDLWEEYAAFLKAYYEIDSKKTEVTKAIFNGDRYPFLYNIC
jgi:hypothetical protein